MGDADIQVSEGEGEDTITVTAPGKITGTRETGIQATRMRITPDGPVMRYLLGSFGGGRVIPLRSAACEQVSFRPSR